MTVRSGISINNQDRRRWCVTLVIAVIGCWSIQSHPGAFCLRPLITPLVTRIWTQRLQTNTPLWIGLAIKCALVLRCQARTIVPTSTHNDLFGMMNAICIVVHSECAIQASCVPWKNASSSEKTSYEFCLIFVAFSGCASRILGKI